MEGFACSKAQATIKPHFGNPLECGLLRDSYMPIEGSITYKWVMKGLRPAEDSRKPM